MLLPSAIPVHLHLGVPNQFAVKPESFYSGRGFLAQTRQRATMALKHREEMPIKVTLPRVAALVADSGDKKEVEFDAGKMKTTAY